MIESVLGTLTRPVRLDLPDTWLTVYLGPVRRPRARNGQPWTETLHEADIALYHAKRSRHRLIVHTPGRCHPAHPAPLERLRDRRLDDYPNRGN